MKFIDNEHKKFFLEKWEEAKENGKTDVYYKSLIYTLSVCETTREHFSEIFDLYNGEVNLNSIQKAWQTSTSLKVTRMALNLWNHSIVYDSEADIENEQISSHYAPSEIFCCSYAPYFWEGIKIRYPEYTNYEKNNKTPRVAMYMRVGNIEQLDYNIEEKINNKVQNKIVGLYIRVGCDYEAGMRYSIDQQRKMLDDYCKENHIENRIEYIDIGKSGLAKDRKALQQMINDIKIGKIDEIIVTDISKLFREPLEVANLLLQDFMKENQITSLNDSAEHFKNVLKLMGGTKYKEQQEDDEVITI